MAPDLYYPRCKHFAFERNLEFSVWKKNTSHKISFPVRTKGQNTRYPLDGPHIFPCRCIEATINNKITKCVKIFSNNIDSVTSHL
jgi:hypothetical protein